MVPAGVRILVCTVPQDMRCSFDALAAVVQQLMGENPQSGSLYIFLCKRLKRVKLLWWDKNGYCLLYKRLHRAFFYLPELSDASMPTLRIDGNALRDLLAGVAQEKKKKEKQQLN